jgi:transposase
LFRLNIRADDIENFIIQLLGCLRQGIIVAMDRWQVHRCAARRLLAGQLRNLCVEWLPAYAPDLNPVEGVWERTKYADLANFIPDDVAHLKYAVRKSLRHTGAEQSILRSLFHYAKLKL